MATRRYCDNDNEKKKQKKKLHRSQFNNNKSLQVEVLHYILSAFPVFSFSIYFS